MGEGETGAAVVPACDQLGKTEKDASQILAMVSRATATSKPDVAVFALAMAVLLAAYLLLGPGLDPDSFCYLLWGREFVGGYRLSQENLLTAPKVIPMFLATVGQLLPGDRSAEHFYFLATAVAGAGLVTLTARLARRLGGGLAGLVAVPLVLGHMQFLRYTLNGQSSIHASLFIVWALLAATREKPAPKDHIMAGLLLFLAGLCRPEAGLLGGALGLALWLRLGWRRMGWPALAAAIALVSVPANVVFNRIAFGSFGYSTALQVEWEKIAHFPNCGIGMGFVSRLARTLLLFANTSSVLVLLAAAGAGLVLVRESHRFAALLLFPLPTMAFVWLMLAKGMYFNERCFFYITFLFVGIAAHGVARLVAWAGASGEFLGALSLRGRAVGFTVLMLAALVPSYVTRPLPRLAPMSRAFDAAAEFLRARGVRPADSPRMVLEGGLVQVLYRLGVPARRVAFEWKRVMHKDPDGVPANVRWYVLDGLQPPPGPLPRGWCPGLAWEDPAGPVAIYDFVRTGELARASRNLGSRESPGPRVQD